MNTFLAVLTGGGLAALGGLLSGWLNNRLGSKRDERAHAREQQAAREALGQERLDRTYTELGIYLSHMAEWARSVRPVIGPVPAPDPVSPEERWRIETLVENHGSPEVRRLLDRWGEQRMKIENADIVLGMDAESRGTGLAEEALRERQALEDYRKSLYEASSAIRDQMRKELAGQAEVPTALARRSQWTMRRRDSGE
jgi:hypothetical protein